MTKLDQRIEEVVKNSDNPKIELPGHSTRRRFFQLFTKIEKARDLLEEQRQIEKKAKRLDVYEDLREAAFHLSRALAYLQHASKRSFGKSLEDLEAYK